MSVRSSRSSPSWPRHPLRVARGASRVRTALALVAAVCTAACAGETPRTSPQLITLPAPRGEREADRRALLEAIGRAQPGGTLQFAAGTYRIGGGIVVPVPHLLLRGAPSGTVLEGCSPAEVAALGETAFLAECAGLVLTGAGQQVRALTFVRFSTALLLAGGQDSIGPLPNRAGGQRVEDNTFRESSSLEVWADADVPTVIRNNRFEHLHHPLQVLGRQVEVRDNRIESTDPMRVPYAWPATAISLRPVRGGACGDLLVEGNDIRGHVEGIALTVLPGDAAGATCERIRIVDNTITLSSEPTPTTARPRTTRASHGVGIRVANLQRAVLDGTIAVSPPPEGWPAAFARASVGLVELVRNRVTGARGVAIELLHAPGAMLAENDVAPVTPLSARDRDALVRAGTLADGAGFWLLDPNWRAANGTAVWRWPAADSVEVTARPSDGAVTRP